VSPASPPRPRGRHWPWLLGALLGTAVLANAVLLLKAHDDPSHAVEPDYYRKALAFDETIAQRRRNNALGWSLALEINARPSPYASLLRARLTDRAGAPLHAAELTLEAFHKARGRRRLRARFAARPDGSYQARLPLRRSGLWELRFVVERAGQRFTRTVEREIAVPTAARERGAAR